MANEIEKVYEGQDITLRRDPEAVLAEAAKAARALARVLESKKDKVMINGVQYLEFEDWQTLARFYGVTAKVIATTPVMSPTAKVDTVIGYEARAVAVRPDGTEISAAEAMCLNDERNWEDKPLFMLRSMAQTRACAKALRNILGWVTILAGYEATPAEEMPVGQEGATGGGAARTVMSGHRRAASPKERSRKTTYLSHEESFNVIARMIGRCADEQSVRKIMEMYGGDIAGLPDNMKTALVEQSTKRIEEVSKRAGSEVSSHDAG